MGDSRDSLRSWGLERPFVAMQKHGKCQGTDCEDVARFQTKFNNGKLDDSFDILELSKSKEQKVEMFNIAINSRKNEAIVGILEKSMTCDRKKMSQESDDSDVLDGLASASIDAGGLYQKGLMSATLNDDPETLEAILRWGDSRDMNPRQGKTLARSQEPEENPILLSSLEGYTACMEHLYKAGYRIRLLNSDWKRVKSELDHNDKNQPFLTSLEKAWNNLIQYKEVCCQSEDPVSRYLLFKAYANPQYLSIQLLDKSPVNTTLVTVDPLRLAFALGHHAQLLARYFPEHTVEYTKIGETCETFTREILAYCTNTRDVVTLLEHSPGEQEQEEQEDKESNWHIALKGEHKSFVSHPYYQHFTWNKIRGTNYDPFTFYLFKRMRAFPIAILLFFVYPFILVLDSIFREGKILFESPDAFRKRKTEEANAKATKDAYLESQEELRPENGFWSFFRERLHRPIYRMSVTLFWEIFFLSMLYLSLTNPRAEIGYAPFEIQDRIMWFFIFNYFLFGLEDLFRQKTDFLSSFWCCYTLFTNLLLISGGGIAFCGGRFNEGQFDRANVDGDHALNIGLTLVAYGAVMQCLRTIRWFLLHRTIGPVVVCFIQVLKDVIYVFAIFLVIYLSFALGIWYMYKPFTYRQDENDSTHCETAYCIKQQTIKGNKGMRGIFSKMFWEVFDGEASDTTIQESKEFHKTDSTRMSMEFSHVMAVSMWAMYQGITAILLINILIALMNSTYMRVWQNVDTEWKYSKTFYQVQFLTPRATLPPPFRWIYYLAILIRRVKMALCGLCGPRTAPVTQDSEKKKELQAYMLLLQKLVKTKMHSEAEASAMEDFKDLRVDLKNMLEEKLQISHRTMVVLQ